MSNPTSYDVQLFPIPPNDTIGLTAPPAGRAPVGVCFSGGGSRALSAALGQMRGLRTLGLMDRVSYVSSVSGGTWASATYNYLPANISDDDFLGLPVAPEDITTDSLSQLSPNNLGNVPAGLSWTHILETIFELKEKYKYPDSMLWQGIIGKYVLEPFGLWNQNLNGFPDRFYSLDAASVQAIIDHNPGLNANQFYTVQRPRPTLIMNGSLVSNPTTRGSQLLPFESTQSINGVRMTFPGKGPDGRTIGGGMMQSFAMGSAWQQDQAGGRAQVSAPVRPFSLVDMVGISSAAFSETVEAKLPHLDKIDPMYQYWPIAGRETVTPYNYLFADGGSLENTGLSSMLSRRVPNVIVFVNSQTPLTREDGEIVLDSQIPLLFGLAPSPRKLRFNEPQRKDIPNDDARFVQVFPNDRYDEVAEGLWAASSAGGPAMYLQTVETAENPNFGVPQYTVNVLWVYNTAVQDWYNLLQPAVQKVVDKTRNFPNYDTVLQLDLSAAEVNLLAHLTCWSMTSQEAMVRKLFGG